MWLRPPVEGPAFETCRALIWLMKSADIVVEEAAAQHWAKAIIWLYVSAACMSWRYCSCPGGEDGNKTGDGWSSLPSISATLFADLLQNLASHQENRVRAWITLFQCSIQDHERVPYFWSQSAIARQYPSVTICWCFSLWQISWP